MAKEPAPTHLNAYVMELQEAEEEFRKLKGKIAGLKRQIDAKRAEEGLEPLYEQQGGKSDNSKSKHAKKDHTPDEASGFGGKGGGNS